VVLGELIARHGIDCEYSVPGIIMAAHTRRRQRPCQARRLLAGARPPGRASGPAEAADMIGSDYYLGAAIDRRGGRINPLAYCAASRGGDQVGRRAATKARAPPGSRRNGGSGSSRLLRREVEADRVFLCTNAYTDNLWPACARPSCRCAPTSSPAALCATMSPNRSCPAASR